MKSLVKYLNRHLKMCVFTVVLLTLVLAGCSGTIGGGNQDEPNKTEFVPMSHKHFLALIYTNYYLILSHLHHQ